MDDELIDLTPGQKARQFTRSALRYILRDILLVDALIFGVVLLSFIFLGSFNVMALSERMAYAGIISICLGGIAIAATGVAGRSFGVPTFIRKPEDAKKLLEKAPDIRREQEKRYNAGARLWLIGMGCIAISAMVEYFFS
jgi:hypothetical protein